MTEAALVSIGFRALSAFAGKLDDRRTGAGGEPGDVYARIAELVDSAAPGQRWARLALSRAEIDELLEEIAFVADPSGGWDRYAEPRDDRDRAELRSLLTLRARLRQARKGLGE